MQITLLATIGVATLILAITAGVTARHRQVRPALIGLGIAAMVVGLYLTGLTQLVADGVLAVIDWFQQTPWTDVTTWGVGLLGGGLLLAVVGAFLPRRAKQAPAASPSKTPPAANASKPQQVEKGQTKPAQVQQPKAKGVDPEDAEIEELLRKRGIM